MAANRLFTQIVGLSTNVDFLMSLATHPSFQAGDVSTDFIPDHYQALFPARTPTKQLLCQVGAAAGLSRLLVPLKFGVEEE